MAGLDKPKVALERIGYEFKLAISNIKRDQGARFVCIEIYVFEKQDVAGKTDKKDLDYKKKEIWIQENVEDLSWTYKLDKNKYYPYVDDGDFIGPRYVDYRGSMIAEQDTVTRQKESDTEQKIKKIVFKVWLRGDGDNPPTSEVIKKTYEFKEPVAPSVDIGYSEDGTSLVYTVDMNEDYSIDSDTKKATTRSYVWLTRKEHNSGIKEERVDGHAGKWYDKDVDKTLRKQIQTDISPRTSVRYTVHAYTAGPNGKSTVKEKSHYFAIPANPSRPKVQAMRAALGRSGTDPHDNTAYYMVDWNIDTKDGWNPVDKVTIQYADQNELRDEDDPYGELITGWSSAKEGLNSSIKRIMTDAISPIGENNVRYFRLLAEHDGNSSPSTVSYIAGYGKPANVTGVTVTPGTIMKDGKTHKINTLTWTNTTCKIYHQDNRNRCLRTKIYLNSTVSDKKGNGLLKVIRYGTEDWNNHTFVHDVTKLDGKPVVYIFQTFVGQDDMDPGAASDQYFTSQMVIPEKITNLSGYKRDDNTSVELEWDNPVDKDTTENSVEIAYSTNPNIWDTSEQPQIVKFEDGSRERAVISGLSEGYYYYFWARTLIEKSGYTDFGMWSDKSKAILLADKKEKPVLTSSRTWIKPRGKVALQWTFINQHGLPQNEATIYISEHKNSGYIPMDHVYGHENKTTLDFDVKRKEDIIYEKGGEITDDQWILNQITYGDCWFKPGTYYLKVKVDDEISSVTSDPIELIIADIPACTLEKRGSNMDLYMYNMSIADEESGAQRIELCMALKTLPIQVKPIGDGLLNLYLYSIDVPHYDPALTDPPEASETCIWSAKVDSDTKVDINDVPLKDNCRYSLRLIATDTKTGLQSLPSIIDFEVHWSHKAVVRSNAVELEVGQNGIINITPNFQMNGLIGSDVFDIYRVTSDDIHVCALGVKQFGDSVTIEDRLPTFGKYAVKAYRVCVRTKNGDVAWRDFPYSYDEVGAIINFGDNYVKLPYNVNFDDNRSKQGEVRAHLGGTKNYYAKDYITRSLSISTTLSKAKHAEIIRQLYELSRYTETCYVRTSTGLGFPATVDVSISQEPKSTSVSVSISCNEVDDDAKFNGLIHVYNLSEE